MQFFTWETHLNNSLCCHYLACTISTAADSHSLPGWAKKKISAFVSELLFHKHGFPISSQAADMFSMGLTQTSGQSLMQYTGHSPVKAGGISRWVSVSQILNIRPLIPQSQSPRSHTRCEKLLNVELLKQIFFLSCMRPWKTHSLHWCNTVLPNFKQQKRPFINVEGLQAAGRLRLFSDGGDAFGSSALSELCVARNPLSEIMKTNSRQWIQSNNLTTCGLHLRGWDSFLNSPSYHFPVAALSAPLLQRQH